MQQHKIMGTPFRPVGNRLLVLPLPKTEKEHKGIKIPASANNDLTEGEVIAISEDVSNLFNVGDILLFPSGSGIGQWYNGKIYLWLQANEVWAVIENFATADKGDGL